MPEDPKIAANVQKILEMIIKVDTPGSGKATSELDKIGNSFKQLTNGAKQAGAGISSAFTSVLTPLNKVAALVGSGLGFSKGIKDIENYSKAIISLSAQMNKYGQGTGDAIKKVDEISKALSLTKAESVGLASQFEKTFHTGNLNSALGILSNIKNVVGSNADAIQKMGSELGAMTMKYPSLQANMEKLGAQDKERLRNHMLMSLATGQMNLQEAKGLQDFVNQNKQRNVEDEKKLAAHNEYVQSMQDLRVSFEEISLIVGKALQPMMKKMAELAKEYRGTITNVVGYVGDIANFLAGWGKYIIIAITGLKVAAGILIGISGTINAMKMLATLFPAGGAGPAASIAAGKAAAASAASAQAAAAKACSCASGVAPGVPGVPGSSTVPGLPPAAADAVKKGMGSKLVGLAGKAAGVITAVAVVSMASEVGNMLGGKIGRVFGAEKGSTAEAVTGGVGSVAAGAAAGAIVGSVVPVLGTAVGAALGAAVGGITSLVKTIADERKRVAQISAESKDTRDKEIEAATAGANSYQISEETRHEKKHLSVMEDKRRRDKKSSRGYENEKKLEEQRYKTWNLESVDELRNARSAAEGTRLFSMASSDDPERRAAAKNQIKEKTKNIEGKMAAAGVSGTADELSDKIRRGEKLDEKVSPEIGQALREKIDLEDASGRAIAHQGEMAALSNTKYEAGLQLRQAESESLDILVQKSLMYGASAESLDAVRNQSLAYQKAALVEMESRGNRINQIKAAEVSNTKQIENDEKALIVAMKDRAAAEFALSGKEGMKLPNEGEASNLEMANARKYKAQEIDKAQKAYAVTQETVAKLEKNIAATGVDLLKNRKEIVAEEQNQNKILIEIQDKYYKAYETLKKMYDVTRNVSGASSRLAESISERMQLTGENNSEELAKSQGEAFAKLNIKRQAAVKLLSEVERNLSIKGQTELKTALESQIRTKGKMANATFADIQKEVDEMSKSIEKGTKRGELEAERANISADIADTEKEKNKIAMAGLGPLEKRITLASSEVAITKSMLAYQDQIGMGIAPSMKMRMQGIQQQGDAIAAQEAYIEKLKTADISEQERQLKLNEAYAKRNAMLGEQLEMSKSLREGWVSALSAQSMFSGRALKIAMTKESNLGTAISGAVNAHISSMTGTNQSGQGARRSSGFEVDASGRQSFRDEGNAYYKQDYRGGGGEIDMEEAKKLSDMALRKDLMKAAEQAKKVYGGVQDMVMTGKATALLGGGSLGASAEYGPNNPRRAAHGEVIPEEKAPPVVPPAGPTSKGKGSGSPVTLTFNINTKAEVENLVKDITERLLTECLMT